MYAIPFHIKYGSIRWMLLFFFKIFNPPNACCSIPRPIKGPRGERLKESKKGATRAERYGGFQPNKTTLKERGSLPIFLSVCSWCSTRVRVWYVGDPTPRAACRCPHRGYGGRPILQGLGMVLITGFFNMPFLHESIAKLPPLGPVEEHKWFFQISSQWASQKNRCALIQFLPPCISNLPLMSYRLWILLSVLSFIFGALTWWIQNWDISDLFDVINFFI